MLDLSDVFDPDRAEARLRLRAEEARRGGAVCGLGPSDLPLEWHFAWDERAAIMEFDSGIPRERAEALALEDVLEQMRRAGGKPGSKSLSTN
jgi:hypothetical protein